MSKPNGYTITLVRAGATSWDEEHRLIGQTDLPMTELGKDVLSHAVFNAEMAAPFDLILTSDEEAAIETARMLPVSAESKLKSIAELHNIHLGLWEGVLASDLQERNPSTFAQWKEHPERIAPPEGESLADAQDRLLNAIQKALGKCKGNRPIIAVVLRPLAWAVVRCWLNEQSICNIWQAIDQTNTLEHFEVMKSSFAERKQSSRASA